MQALQQGLGDPLDLTAVGQAGQAVAQPALDVVDRVVASQLAMPEGFTVHPRLAPQLQRRKEMVDTDAIDWGMGEALAIGSLLAEGVKIGRAHV